MSELLLEAQKAVADRHQIYGHPEDNFRRVADLWSVILDHSITVEDVALCLIALKIARLTESPNHRDSMVDIAGYAACLADCGEGDA